MMYYESSNFEGRDDGAFAEWVSSGLLKAMNKRNKYGIGVGLYGWQ